MNTHNTKQQPFQHEPLSQPATHIRLLKLFPFHDELAPMAGEVVEFARSELRRYLALSYVWGPETPMVTIYLHEKPVGIHQNLYAFLWHYLRTGRSDLLWTDALCINQTDPVEKGLQVESMGETFRGASAVVIWLGPPEQTVSEIIAAAANVPGGKDASFPKHSGQHYADVVKRLSKNPYWTRAWIVQQFILAQALFVQYGSTWLTWDDFLVYFLPDSIAGATRATHSIDPDESLAVTPCPNPHIDELIDRRRLWHDPGSDEDATTLMDLVALNRSRKCKDPRDRVYGVLALSRRQTPGSIAITADYAITSVELFFRVMEAHNAVVLKSRYYSREPVLEALELDRWLSYDSLRNCLPPASPRAHIVSCDGPIFIRARPVGMFDPTSPLPVCSLRQWCEWSPYMVPLNPPEYRVDVLSPIHSADFGAGGHGETVSIHSLHDLGYLSFVHRCRPDKPAASIAYAEEAFQQSNLENLDAIATEAFCGLDKSWDVPLSARSR
ncbi:hypothetical protein PV05_11954 [Exophiala xenobiotica]|uniref:Heterokaryon incompatibility domain-containing protein n=1 Tax=Exophiala xenobiotica TaxID=348802 RepID=A0A0D2E4K4_9EURO|nr:uncharacterized protein PV05_11954 [Exophiala xenobiotica]KIW50358.1 hypothetical protein PV05_11954 [Exophiala xenobiotica]